MHTRDKTKPNQVFPQIRPCNNFVYPRRRGEGSSSGGRIGHAHRWNSSLVGTEREDGGGTEKQRGIEGGGVVFGKGRTYLELRSLLRALGARVFDRLRRTVDALAIEPDTNTDSGRVVSR